MYRLILPMLMILSISVFATDSVPTEFKRVEPLTVRITYYHRFQDKYKDNTSIGIKAEEGITVAADPSIPFGTEVYVPQLKGIVGDGKFIVQDRGTDVTRRKASNGKTLVIDVYVWVDSRREGRKRLRELMTTMDDYMTIYIKRPQLFASR